MIRKKLRLCSRLRSEEIAIQPPPLAQGQAKGHTNVSVNNDLRDPLSH